MTEMRIKLYDPKHQRLLYLDQEASACFWDAKWEAAAKATFADPPRHRATVSLTQRYLSAGSHLLEGGCGIGDVVHALDKAGYRAEGIDYAPNIIESIQRNWPHLNVQVGDVRALPYQDGSFDGYWSFGVIEHFPAGYESIACEMRRVLRTGGYLFLSFPCFNAFRRFRARLGAYAVTTESASDIKDFFQFALNPMDVREHFERLGFDFVSLKSVATLQCLADEFPFFEWVQRKAQSIHPRLETVISRALDLLFGRIAGHSCLLIFRKNDKA